MFLFGYPTTLTGIIPSVISIIATDEPLLRKGVVAGLSSKSDKIILDCPSYGGNSGGPVVQVDREPFGGGRFRPIGIVVSFIPYTEIWENRQTGMNHLNLINSGYSIVEPIDAIVLLLW